MVSRQRRGAAELVTGHNFAGEREFHEGRTLLAFTSFPRHTENETLKTTILRSLAAAAVALGIAAPAASAGVGPDYVSSDNVEYVGPIREAGDGVGARIVGDKLYVTSTTHLLIYDIKSDPAAPKLLGTFTLNIEFENEEVPTNGKILGISSDTFCVIPDPNGIGNSGSAVDGGCLSIYDVSNPSSIKLLSVVKGAGNHTSTCVFDCKYFVGNEGTLVDATDPANAKIVEGGWKDTLEDQEVGYCHHVRELDPGVILGACNPVALFSMRPQDGGSPTAPALISKGELGDTRLIHSNRWPQNGRDRWVLVGGETNASGTCDDTVGAFMTFDAKNTVNPAGGFFNQPMTLVDEFRPTSGTYQDGKSPYNALGCSVHWFEEHPTFRNGGLVALATYENGTRFMQIGPDGKITEQGFFLPAGGSTSAPHWNPYDPTIVYSIDYARGIDILKYTGDLYVPNAQGQVVLDPNKKPGTGGAQPDAPACASAAGFRDVKLVPKGGKVTFQVDKREDRPFTVDVFQQSQGKKVVKERLIQRFKNKKATFTWNGKDRKKRKLGSGNYFVRFTMKTASGVRDTRRATLMRAGSKFRNAPDFYQRVDCGIFKSLKLTSSVFGGRTKEKLGISYQLEIPVKSVKIAVKVGSKTVKTFKGKGARRKTFRFSLKPSIARAGKLVKVIVTPERPGSPSPTITLTAKRL